MIHPVPLHVCLHKARSCAEKAGGKAHYVYLIAATIFDGNIIIRLTTAGCLVFCVLAEVLKDEEQA